MELDPRRLRVLRAVAVRGGVMDAARLLHLTPSAVSQQLAQLEREVGQPLVDRSRRRVALTPAGRLLAARAERIERELAEARRELTELSGRMSGPVTIAAFSSAICHLLVPALDALARAHPELAPRVVEREGPEAVRDLRAGGLDLVVAEHDGDSPEPADWQGLSVLPVADDDYLVVVPASWAAPQGTPSAGAKQRPRSGSRAGPPTAMRDLAGRPWVAGPADTACGRALERLGAEHGFTADLAHTCREFPTVLAMVAAGAGAAVVPTLALGGAPPHGVAAPPVPVAGHRRITCLGRKPGAAPEPLGPAVADALREAAAAAGLVPVASR